MEILNQKKIGFEHQRKLLLQLKVQEAATVNLTASDLSQLRADMHPG